MPILLPVTDVSAAIVGGVTRVSFDRQAAPSARPQPLAREGGRRAHLYLNNESGCELIMFFPVAGHTWLLPAGGWRLYELAPGESSFTFTVDAILPNAPISRVYATYYSEYESPPPPMVLGNSPIGVGGLVTTTGQTPQKATTNAVQNGTGAFIDVIGASLALPSPGTYLVFGCLRGVHQPGGTGAQMRLLAAGVQQAFDAYYDSVAISSYTLANCWLVSTFTTNTIAKLQWLGNNIANETISFSEIIAARLSA